MLAAYLITLIVGGVLVVVSLVAGDGGGDGAETGGDAGADGHGEVSHGGDALDALMSWLPLSSLRFWTFFAAFFGLTGTALSVLSVAGPIATGIAAALVGYASGLALTRIVGGLQKSSSDSSLAAADLIGATAHVLLPVAAGRTGKVRLHLKGRTVDVLAETQEPAELVAGERALVIAAPRDGHVVIARVGQAELS
jgi:membrane protein implicated in regulation of membrane protease activity